MAQPATAPTFEPGSTLAGFRVEGLIGSGGMGVVYRATQLALDRVVALKVVSPEIARDETFRNRFVRESRVAAALDHPNVVPIYEAGEADGLLYLAMRYVEGEDLRSRVEREGRLDPITAAGIISQVAAALDQAHTRGMVHRDVKPGNVLIEAGEHAYLTDFGLAKPLGTEDAALTQTGVFVGTLDYIAPEQIQGSAVDARVDVYALGALLYFALTGDPPYPRDTPVASLWAHVNEPPPLASALASVPTDLDVVIARAMAKQPDERYPSAGELARAAQAAAAGEPLPEVMPSVAPELGAAGAAAEARSVGIADPAERPIPVPPAPATPPRPAVPPPPSARVPAGSVEVRIPIRDDFRYVHRPLRGMAEASGLLGNEEAVIGLTERILHSDGGSFLITGFRGVGKTTVVEQVLARLGEASDRELIDVKLNVARPKRVDQLMFEIMRRLFERLEEERVLERLDPSVRRELLLAYMRTSLSFNETRSDSTQRSRKLALGIPEPLGGVVSPGLEMSRTSSEELATQAAFLAYTDADVEHDFLRIVNGLLKEPRPEPTSPPATRRWPWSRSQRTPALPRQWRGRLIVVIDELDKLTATRDGKKSLTELLNGLKNLLTAPGVHFLFVGGGDLHDDWLLDSRRGNSVFESVFGWQLYVPCLHDPTRRLLDAVVPAEAKGHPTVKTLHAYLEYKARGIPRLLLMELNSFVRWDDDRPEIVIGGPNLAVVEFYADLEQTLAEFLNGDAERPAVSLPIDEDRWRLGAYYVTDWILRTRDNFTVKDIVKSFKSTAIDPQLALSEGKVKQLLAHLVAHGTLGTPEDARETFHGDVLEAQEPIYWLNRDVENKLSAFARINERERADLAPDSPGTDGGPRPRQPWLDTDAGRLVHDRYELLEELDRAGSGRVYRTYDRLELREVAIKMVDVPQLATNDLLKARFLRKGKLAKRLRHPNIVRTHDVFADDHGPLAIVMDIVDGIPLAQLLGQARLAPSDAIAIAVALGGALDYLNRDGLARLDLKPSRIMLDHERKPVILDLGLIKEVQEASEDELTAAGVKLGTPLYAAPEQLTGGPVDIRADICSLGLILFEMIAGRQARPEGDLMTVLMNAVAEDVDVSRLDVSPELREVVRRCIARDPKDRFDTPAAMIDELAHVPEAPGIAEATGVEHPAPRADQVTPPERATFPR